MTYKILSNCSLLLAREKNSITELENFGISQSNIQITKESVISLNRLFTLYQRPSLREKQIGIAIYATQKRTEKNHQAYIHTIGDSCKYFVNKGYKVIFFPMELKDTAPDDRILIQEILQYINLPQQCSYIDVDMPTDIHLQAVSKCQCFIGHKTHSTIFALASGTPLIGIAYHPKTEEFMEQFGINQFCINDQELSIEVVIEKFNLLENDLDNIGKHLFEQARVSEGALAPLIHTDRGSAYISKAFNQYLAINGTCHSYSAPGTPADNAVIEHWWADFKAIWIAHLPKAQTLTELE